ncbi:GNAT family N-acetyltransferase [Streptosporangium sp. NPDC023963]|uniref:GNAT family N-acetyltransferase n=1 Tax=Streptosporangium sp. NPDC023963 TaxID=3155608 RepID=UPI00342FF5B8
MSQDRLTALAEGAEAEFMYQYESFAPPSVASLLGITTARIGGGVALSMRHDVTGYWSKALGFGFEEPITGDLVDRVVDFYRAEDSKGAVIQIAPDVLPPDWDDIRAGHGIVPGSSWVKLSCPIDEFRPGRTGMRVGPVGPGAASEWASVVLRGFGMPEEGLAEMLAASVGHPAFRPFAVWDGDEMVAGANLFVHGEIGSLNAASTLPGHRNRGAQSALLAARAKEAANAGCRRLVAEAGLPAEGSANPSLNNMLAAGLRPLYNRRNWIWRPDAGPAGGS